jgi:hypothetical protein
MRLIQAITRRRRLVIAGLLVVAAAADVWRYRHRQYELQFVGHWIWDYHAGEKLERSFIPFREGLTLFSDGTGFLRHEAAGAWVQPDPIRWWASGHTLVLQYLQDSEWKNLREWVTSELSRFGGPKTIWVSSKSITEKDHETRLSYPGEPKDRPSYVRLPLEITEADRHMDDPASVR